MADYVQRTSGFVNAGGSAAPALTGVTAGNSLILVITGGVDKLPTDSSGQTWTKAKSQYDAGGEGASMYFLASPNAGTHTVTYAPGGSNYFNYALMEVPKITGVDVAGAFAQATGGSLTTLTASITTSAASTLLVAAIGLSYQSSFPTNVHLTDPPTGWNSAYLQGDANAANVAENCTKVVSSAGAQSATWNFDADGSAIFASGFIVSFAKAASGTSVSPGVGSLALTGYAPTIARTANQEILPGVGALAISGYAPTVARTANQSITPDAGSMTITGYAPTIGQTSGATVAPGVGTLSLTGYAPSIAQTANQSVSPGAGSITLTGYAPTVSQPQAVNPGVGSLSITGYAPSVTQPIAVLPGAGLLSITGYAPALTQTASQSIAPDVGSLVLTGYAPTVVQASASISVNPGVGQITITGYPPEVSQSHPVEESGGHKKKKRKRATWSGIPLTQLYPDYEPQQLEVIAEVAQVAAEAPKPPTKRRAVSYLKEYGLYRERYAKVLLEVEQMIRQELEEDEMEALLLLGI